MSRKTHRQGGKFTGSHTTIIDAAAVVVDTAKRREEVTKICLSIIQNVRSNGRRLKFKSIQAGWQVIIYGNTYMQDVYIYTSNPETTKQAIEQAFAR